MSSPETGRRPDADNEAAGPRRRRGGAGAEGATPADTEESARDREPGSPTPPRGATAESSGWTFRDFLIPYILLALSIQRAHGYVIEQYLRGLGLVNLEMSTLYRTLRQLEKDGLVSSAWEPGPDGPARRIYSLTEAGRWWLDAGAAALAGYRTLIDRFFGTYPGPTPGPDREDREKGPSR